MPAIFSEQLPNFFLSFLLGGLILAPILTAIIIICFTARWVYRLPRIDSQGKKGPNPFTWLSLQENEICNKDAKCRARAVSNIATPKLAFPCSMNKRGWLRVTTTPNPTQTPTIFEMMQDMMVKNWNSSANFFTNTSAFALNIGNSLASLKNKKPVPEVSACQGSNEQGASNDGLSGILDANSTLQPTKNNETEEEEAFANGNFKPNDHRKCKPSQLGTHGWYYAVLRESTLSLFKDATCQELMTVLRLPMYDIGLYPFSLSEGDLYHVSHPILLAGHSVPVPDPINPSTSSSHEAHFSNSDPIRTITGFTPSSVSSSQSSTCASSKMWLPNYYLFAETSVEKEDWLQFLLPHCRFAFSNSEQLRRLHRRRLLPVSKETITGLSSQSLKLSPVGLDPFLHEDLRTRLVGVDSKRESVFNEAASPKRLEEMTWFNALTGRLYLGLRGSTHLQKMIKDKFQSQARKVLPWWLQLKLESATPAPRLPQIFNTPKLHHLDSRGQLKVRVPIQHFGPLADLHFSCCLFPPGPTSLWSSFLSFLHCRFSINLQIGLEIDQPFQTDVIVQLLGVPTLNCWVGAKTLPRSSQIHFKVTIGSRSFKPPPWLIDRLLSQLGDILVYPNLIPIPFFSKDLMTAALPSLCDMEQPLPLLIQTLTHSRLQRSESLPDRKSVVLDYSSPKVATAAVTSNLQPPPSTKSLAFPTILSIASNDCSLPSPDSKDFIQLFGPMYLHMPSSAPPKLTISLARSNVSEPPESEKPLSIRDRKSKGSPIKKFSPTGLLKSQFSNPSISLSTVNALPFEILPVRDSKLFPVDKLNSSNLHHYFIS